MLHLYLVCIINTFAILMNRDTHGVESLGDDKNVVDPNSKEQEGNH